MINFHTYFSKAGGILSRLGYVIYTVVYIFWVLWIINDFYESHKLGTAMFFSGIAAIGVLIFLEIVRRVLTYIFAEEPIFKKKFPLITRVLLGLSLLILAASAPLYLFIDMPELKGEKEAAYASYQEALQELPYARDVAATCEKDRKENPPESAECRRMKLGYQSCLELLQSKTMCLSSWDYESACKPSFLTRINTCQTEVYLLERTVTDYEVKYGKP